MRRLWEQIVPFAQYGFNKSHSVAYAHVAYLTAYLKTQYPAHFMAAMLTSEASNTAKLAMYLGRCRHMGIRILPPDINASQLPFTVEPEGIRFGLIAVKGVGEAAVSTILAVREREEGFTSVAHFLRSLPARTVNHKVVECLAKAGCFDAFGITRKGLVDNLERLTEMASREREQGELGQGFLFEALPSEELEGTLHSAGPAEDDERLAWEREVLGFYLSGHPLDRYAEPLKIYANSRIAELPSRLADGWESVSVGGLLTGVKVMTIRKEGRNQGRRMASFQLEDPSGTLRCVVFPDAFDQVNGVLEEGRPALVTGSLKGDGEHVELMVEDMAPLEGIELRDAAALRIILHLDQVDESRLEELRELLLAHSGPLGVRFELVRRGVFRARMWAPPVLCVDPSPELRASLDRLLGEGRVELEFNSRPTNGKPGPSAAAAGAGEEAPAIVN